MELLPFDIEVAKREPERVRLVREPDAKPEWVMFAPDDTAIIGWPNRHCESYGPSAPPNRNMALNYCLGLTPKKRTIRIRLYRDAVPLAANVYVACTPCDNVDADSPINTDPDYVWIGEAFEREIPA